MGDRESERGDSLGVFCSLQEGERDGLVRWQQG